MTPEKVTYEGPVKEWLTQQFEAYNTSQGYALPKEEFCYALRNSNGEIKAVARGYFQVDWLHLNDLAVAVSLRKSGLGSELLQFVENLAIERQCRGITLNTLGFQAPEFYRKHGYEEYARLEDFGGTSKHFFKKVLG